MGSSFVAFLAISLVALNQSTEDAAPRTTVSVGSLKDMPNTTIRYYDVAGVDVTSINRSIARQRPKDPGAKLAPASTDWTVKVGFEREARQGQCRIRDARADFAATADLPRLVNREALEPALLARWEKYVAALEQSEMATLAFVYSQLGAVEQQVRASSCDQAKAAAGAAIAELQRRAAAFEAERKHLQPTPASFKTTEFQPSSQPVVCKMLIPSGTRVNTLRICMTRREWRKLHDSGQQATREMQDKPRTNRPF